MLGFFIDIQPAITTNNSMINVLYALRSAHCLIDKKAVSPTQIDCLIDCT